MLPEELPGKDDREECCALIAGERDVLWETRRKAEEECFAPKSFASRKIADI